MTATNVVHPVGISLLCRRASAVFVSPQSGVFVFFGSAAMQRIAGAGEGAGRACTGTRHRRADGRQWRPAETKAFVVRAKR